MVRVKPVMAFVAKNRQVTERFIRYSDIRPVMNINVDGTVAKLTSPSRFFNLERLLFHPFETTEILMIFIFPGLGIQIEI